MTQTLTNAPVSAAAERMRARSPWQTHIGPGGYWRSIGRTRRFFAVDRALGLHHQTVQRCVERAVAEGPMAASLAVDYKWCGRVRRNRDDPKLGGRDGCSDRVCSIRHGSR